jgi:hypothetical protein
VVDTEYETGLRSGLAPLGGLWVNEEGYPGAHRSQLLTQGKASTIVCRVRKNGITAMCDGRNFIDFQGPWERLGELRYYEIPVSTALSVASWKSEFKLTRLVVHTRPGDLANNSDSPATPSNLASADSARANIAQASANQGVNSSPEQTRDVPTAVLRLRVLSRHFREALPISSSSASGPS